jgi:hypothetical protein
MLWPHIGECADPPDGDPQMCAPRQLRDGHSNFAATCVSAITGVSEHVTSMP